MRIIHSPLLGAHIDLDSISAIEDAYFIDKMGSGGYFVGFRIHLKLHDSPLKYSRPLRRDEQGSSPEDYCDLVTVTGRFIQPSQIQKDSELLCCERLQLEINQLVAQWKAT